MTYEEFQNQPCKDYLDLCSWVVSESPQNEPQSFFCWGKTHPFREQYGDVTVAIEVLHQFAVKAVTKASNNQESSQRMIPARLKDLQMEALPDTKCFRGNVQKLGDFYTVTIVGLDKTGHELGTLATVNVAVVAPKH